jgi:hypothetical protein
MSGESRCSRAESCGTGVHAGSGRAIPSVGKCLAALPSWAARKSALRPRARRPGQHVRAGQTARDGVDWRPPCPLTTRVSARRYPGRWIALIEIEGEGPGGLLPPWSVTPHFLFTTDADTSGAEELWPQIHASLQIVLGYDSGDALEQIIAERIVVSSYRMIPLRWLPQVYGLRSRVRDFKPPAADDRWPLADVWLEGESK